MTNAGPLRIVQAGFIAGITVVLVLGIRWGLPSRQKMEMLLAGGGPTPHQVELLNSLHALRASGQIPADSVPARHPLGARPEPYSTPVPPAFTEVERLYALRGYILGTSAPDEDYTMVAIGSMNPRKLDFDPKRYIYGGAYLYPVGFVLMLMEASGLLHVTRDFASYLHDPTPMVRLFVAGRLLNVLAMVGTLIVLVRMGRRLGSEKAGTLAMLSYGLSPMILEYTPYMKPHVFTAFWAALAVDLLLEYVQRDRRRYLVLSGLAAGYAAGSSALAAALGLLYPVLLFQRGNGRRFAGQCLGAWAAMAIAFLVTNPFVLYRFHAYMANAGGSALAGRTLGRPDLVTLGWYLHGAFVSSYAFPVCALGLMFMLVCCFRGSGLLRRLALATVLLLLAFGTTSAQVRISLFMAPLYCLFAGFALVEWIARPLGSRKVLATSLVGLLLLPAALNAAVLARDAVFDSVWVRPTTEWVRSAPVGPGTSIGVFFAPRPENMPPFPFLHAHLIDLNSETVLMVPPEYVLIGNYRQEDRRLWMAHPLQSRYRLLHDLGLRPSYDWLRRGDPALNEARTGGYVYRLIDRAPPP